MEKDIGTIIKETREILKKMKKSGKQVGKVRKNLKKKRINKETIVAYIAGIIDGEGCIAICRRKLKRVKNNNWYYEPQIIVSNTRKEMVDFCASYYGGWIANAIGRIHNRDHKKIYHWKATGDEIKALLNDVFPYLIIKRKQAKIVLSFPNYMNRGWGAKGSLGRSEEELKGQEDLWIEIRKLNSGFRKRGRVVKEE